MINRKKMSIRSSLMVQLIKVDRGLHPDESFDIRYYGADILERAVWNAAAVPRNYRYHSHDPLNGVFIFIEDANTMSHKEWDAAYNNIVSAPGVEVTYNENITTVRRGDN
jgi:hypothetical protein